MDRILRAALLTAPFLVAGCNGELFRPTALDFGDSVSIGYSAFARQDLSQSVDYRHDAWDAGGVPVSLYPEDVYIGKVVDAATNDRYSTILLATLQRELTPDAHYTVILFNSGLHDVQLAYGATATHYAPNVPLPVYQANLEAAATLAGRHADVVIWIDTTPVPPGIASGSQWYGVPVGEESPYNQAADEIARAHGFYVLKLDIAGQRAGDVHFTLEGYSFLGQQVAACVMTALDQAETDECHR